MKILLDTHVLITGLIDPLSPASRIVRMAIDGTVQLFVTEPILSDYRQALARPAFGIDPNHAQTLLAFLGMASVNPPSVSMLTGDIFRSAALSGHVDRWIVADDAPPISPAPKAIQRITAGEFIDQSPPRQDVAARTGPAILTENPQHTRS